MKDINSEFVAGSITSTENTIVFEVTARSLELSPNMFNAICTSIKEISSFSDIKGFTNGETTYNNISEFLESVDTSFDDKAELLNSILSLVVYNPSDNSIRLSIASNIL